MANILRTIYTQGDVVIKSMTPGAGHLPTTITGAAGFHLSGVQSANYSCNTPQQDVNAFGFFGTVDKVQVEPSTATMELSMVIVNSGNPSGWLQGLVEDSKLANPSGWDVNVSGVGHVTGAILTSFRMEAAVGALPTIAMTFDGSSGAFVNPLAQGSTYTPVTLGVATPNTISGLMWNNGIHTTGCPQSVRVSWEMPVERVNCLGLPINNPTVFTRPPGTMSFTAEGIDYSMLGEYITGITIGDYTVAGNNVREVSRTVNMAVGEVGATYNITSETTAIGAVVINTE